MVERVGIGGRAGVGGVAAVALVVALGALMALASGAFAVAKYPDRVIAGQSTNGTAIGQLSNNPRGVAVNDRGVADGSLDPVGASTDGYVYVADMSNHRIQVFDADGNFRFVIGSGVAGGSGGEVCDLTELPCTPAQSGSGAREFNNPQGVAVNWASIIQRFDTGQSAPCDLLLDQIAGVAVRPRRLGRRLARTPGISSSRAAAPVRRR